METKEPTISMKRKLLELLEPETPPVWIVRLSCRCLVDLADQVQYNGLQVGAPSLKLGKSEGRQVRCLLCGALTDSRGIKMR